MNHSEAGEVFACRIADEVRVEMARKKLTRKDLALALGVSEHTAGTRLNGIPHFNTVELAITAGWLSMTVTELIARATAVPPSRQAEAIECRNSQEEESAA